MEMVQKAPAATKGFKIIFVIFFLLFFNTAKSQNNNFQKSFTRNFKYPESLKNVCTATYAAISIDISAQGTVSDVSISDSAPRVFKEEFGRIKNLLDIASLLQLIKVKHLKGALYLYPYFMFMALIIA